MTVGGAATDRKGRVRMSDGRTIDRGERERGVDAVRVSRTAAVEWDTRRDRQGPAVGAAVFCCACLSGVCKPGGLAQVCQCKQARVSATIRTGRVAGAYPCTEPVSFRMRRRFRLCSGRPTCGRAPGAPARRRRRAPAEPRPRRPGTLAGATLDLRLTRPVGRSPADRRRRGLHRTRRRSRQRPSPSSSPDATSSRPPRPAPARPPPSRCRSSIGSGRTPTRPSRRPATRSAR